jgi:transposase-like protein
MERTNSIAETSRTVGCSEKAVKRWWSRHKQQKQFSVRRAKGAGPKPTMSENAAKRALELLANCETHGAADVAKKLKAEGLCERVVHKTTVIRAARQVAVKLGKSLKVKRGKPKKGLTQSTKTKRLKFAKANKRRGWRNVMFTDRSKFHLRYPGSKVKAVRWVVGDSDDDGEEDVYQPSHPQCLNVYAGITKYGMTSVHVVAGSSKHQTTYTNKKGQLAKNITHSEYKEVLTQTLLPEGQKKFSAQGISSWLIQMDNDPSHSQANTVIAEYNKKNGCSIQKLPDWPPNSPDLNIIENVWGDVGSIVNEMGCKSFEEFKQAVITTIKTYPQNKITNLYNSLQRRLELVLANSGGKTRY